MKDFSENPAAQRPQSRRRTSSSDISGSETRPAGTGRALVGALAVSVLAANLAEAATLPEGFVTLGSDLGVASSRVLADGSLEVTLADGTVRTYAAGEFVVLESGEIAVSAEVAEALAALAEAVPGVGMAAVGAAALLGVALGGSDADSEEPPPPPAQTFRIELSNVEAGTGGFVINGACANDMSGRSVSNAGDVNGDGFDDLIVGATGHDPNGSDSGASFVVFGKTNGTAVELSDIRLGTGGFVINGVSADDRAGFSVSAAGDVNGDGLADLIVGAPLDDPNDDDSGPNDDD